MSRKILVTAGLPYANGDIHLGHLVEYIQTDIWVRFQKLRGNETYYFCGDDTHGTAIMIAAKNAGLSPEDYVAKIKKIREEDFKNFDVDFTHYSSTNSPANKKICETVFYGMQEKGSIVTKDVEQAYCEHDKMFLPDRYVKGTCPNCGAEDQYGDTCDICAATYAPTELKKPYCNICGNSPIRKKSEHLLFRLNDYKDFLKEWIPKHNDKDSSKKLLEWFDEELRDWDISRDAPYFGFEIPGYPGKYFYVWVDAPVGYIAASEEYFKTKGKSYLDYWKNDEVEIYHFIGKDILYFHSLFWPAMLKAAGLNTPTRICVHGMLTVNGVKMSKSKGTFINARTYLKHLDPMYLRYYYACKLSSTVEDIDLNLKDMVARVNSDLIGKITNLISRGGSMLTKKMDANLGALDAEGEKLFQETLKVKDLIAEHFENRNYSKAIVEIRKLAEHGNRYFDEKEPWKLIKEEPEKARLVLTNIINFYKNIAVYLKPILPSYAKKVEELLNIKELNWLSLEEKIENYKINTYEHIASRIDEKKVEQMVEDSKPKEEVKKETNEISIDDFTKIDLKIAKVIEAEAVPEADKLLRVVVQVGDTKKQVFAGIKSAYKAESLIGKHVVIVNNLKARKMRFGLSEGMLLAASGKEGGPFLITVDEGAKDGYQVK